MTERAVVISCIDYRINQRAATMFGIRWWHRILICIASWLGVEYIFGDNIVGRFVARLGMDCFLVTRGGSIQDLIRPLREGFRLSLLRDVRVGVKGHGATKIILIGHENCAAYAHFNFNDREKEIQQHHKDLFEAKAFLETIFPGIVIELYFAELIPGTKDRFVIKPV